MKDKLAVIWGWGSC